LRDFPGFSGRRAILAGDRELHQARRSPWGQAERTERFRFMGATIYQCYTFCQGKNLGQGRAVKSEGRNSRAAVLLACAS
jgi:hypothetical protein